MLLDSHISKDNSDISFKPEETFAKSLQFTC